MKKAIIFDLDGTLWDSAKGVVDAWNEIIETFPDFNKKITMDDMYSLMGKTMDEIAYTYFDTVSKERALEMMKKCTAYENDYLRNHGGILYPQVNEVLSELSKNYFLSIVSNCQDGYIEAFLDYYGLGKYFDDTECFERTGKCKGDNIKLLMERNHLSSGVYVGDTLGDYNSTMEAGLPFIHARYGFGKVPQAEHTIDSLPELVEIVNTIL